MNASTPQHVYLFADGRADGDASMRDLLGGKGANLAEMANLGLPVPPGLQSQLTSVRRFRLMATRCPSG